MNAKKDPDKSTPAGRDDDKSGYAERLPRDRDDARHTGQPPKTDPDVGGLERDPEDDADLTEDD